MSDGWKGEESQLNHIGTGITVIPSILASLLLWGVIPIQVPVPILVVCVAVCGLVGGALNLYERGPIAAGALIGLVMALGGFAAVYWWIQGRESIRKFELILAFIIGAAPGFVLQFVIQRVMAGKTKSKRKKKARPAKNEE